MTTTTTDIAGDGVAESLDDLHLFHFLLIHLLLFLLLRLHLLSCRTIQLRLVPINYVIRLLRTTC